MNTPIISATFRTGQSVRVLPQSYPIDIECGAKREDAGGWPGVVAETDDDPLSCYCWVEVDGERWHVSHDRLIVDDIHTHPFRNDSASL